jgi:hypothetical protein
VLGSEPGRGAAARRGGEEEAEVILYAAEKSRATVANAMILPLSGFIEVTFLLPW